MTDEITRATKRMLEEQREARRKRIQEELAELGCYRLLLENIVPCGETVEDALMDETSVIINAPRALLICGFKFQVALLLRLKKDGLLVKEGPR